MGMTAGEKKAYNKGFESGADSVEEGLPGWFGTFADMMTLLFAFFVLLAAISTMDPVKLQEMANSEGKSLGSEIEASGKAEESGEFEPIKNLAAMKKQMEEAIEEMKKENPSGDPPLDIQTSTKGGSPEGFSFFISSIASSICFFIAARFLMGSNSPDSSAFPLASISLPKDLPSEFAISCNFTGSIVEIAARSTKNAKRRVIISANVPNQPGKPSSTESAPDSKPLL
jgi:flagellar motor protein MotB